MSGLDNDYSEKKDCFGMCSINRVQCGGVNRGIYLYGNELPTDSYIQLVISGSTDEYRHGEHHYTRDKDIIKIRISLQEFTNLLTSINHYNGVPVTIESVLNEKDVCGMYKVLSMYYDCIYNIY